MRLPSTWLLLKRQHWKIFLFIWKELDVYFTLLGGGTKSLFGKGLDEAPFLPCDFLNIFIYICKGFGGLLFGEYTCEAVYLLDKLRNFYLVWLNCVFFYFIHYPHFERHWAALECIDWEDSFSSLSKREIHVPARLSGTGKIIQFEIHWSRPRSSHQHSVSSYKACCISLGIVLCTELISGT